MRILQYFDKTLNLKFLYCSLPAPKVPSSDRYMDVLPDAATIAIVLYAINISMAKIFAKKHSYEVDPNQVK